jgi:NAD-dependent dihydropyrimidine dehydrogenase PreA subunit
VTYVIALPCVDVKDRACVDECPVDCIYEGGRSLYIHPDECVDCGACEPVCPVDAIAYEDDVPERWEDFIDDNARFFSEPLPGITGPIGSPGGAAKLGPFGVDTELVAGYPPLAERDDLRDNRNGFGK